MASKPQSDSKDSSGRDRLPFEPTQGRKKPDKKVPPQPIASKVAAESKPVADRRSSGAIPEEVSRRMVRRMVIFCGVPTLLGISTFLVSYQVVTHDIFPLPHSAVLLVSLGFFGLGVVGLSYGALSASWDESRSGGMLGWSEFRTNLPRISQAFRSAQKDS